MIVTFYVVYSVDSVTRERSWCRNFWTTTEAENYIQHKLKKDSTKKYEIDECNNQEVVYEVK